jgi:hypothetical protein
VDSKGSAATNQASKDPRAVIADFTVTKVTPGRYRRRYDTAHDVFRSRVMIRLWRNSLEVAVAAATIVFGTLIVHLVISWWSAAAALH